MTAGIAVTSQLLPVSILAGPSGRGLLQDITREAQHRLGLLASSSADSQQIHDQLMVEHLAAADGGGYDPERIRAQISAIAESALIDHLIIECDSKTHPIAFASLFLPDDGDGQRFSQTVRLSSILLAADAHALLSSIVQGERVPGVTSPSILADQIECADVVVLSGEPASRSFLLAQAVTLALNPRARILQRSALEQKVHPKLLDPRDSFDFEVAFAGAGWRKLMDAETGIQKGEQSVTSFVYRARRPFHPLKFWNLIQDPLPGVFRAKGFFWLATRMGIVGGLNIAGAECHYSPAGQWWAAHAGENHSGHAEVPDRLKNEWAEPYGDRRQAIALMGIDLDFVNLSKRLDACLLDDSEMNSGEPGWTTLADPFPAWSAKTHHHECEDHDCRHH